MMTPFKQKLFRAGLVILTLLMGLVVYDSGAFESMQLGGAVILSIAFGLVAIGLYKYISDDDTYE